MEIKRDLYLNKLIERKENQSIKIITGIRRCGKSYLLFHLFYNYLLQEGISKDHIICIALDDDEHEELLNALREKSIPFNLIIDNVPVDEEINIGKIEEIIRICPNLTKEDATIITKQLDYVEEIAYIITDKEDLSINLYFFVFLPTDFLITLFYYLFHFHQMALFLY